MHPHIAERSIPEPNSGCVLWNRSYFRSGYGQAWHEGTNQPAHRVSWILSKGEIPAGMCVCHRCDVKGCVNPDHLWLGTHLDNMADRSAKNRQHRPKGELQGGHKLTEKAVRDILAEQGPISLKRAAELGAMHGVSAQHIYRIRRRDRWGHIKVAA